MKIVNWLPRPEKRRIWLCARFSASRLPDAAPQVKILQARISTKKMFEKQLKLNENWFSMICIDFQLIFKDVQWFSADFQLIIKDLYWYSFDFILYSTTFYNFRWFPFDFLCHSTTFNWCSVIFLHLAEIMKIDW